MISKLRYIGVSRKGVWVEVFSRHVERDVVGFVVSVGLVWSRIEV